MTDDPNSATDALDPSDEWTVPDLLRAIETAVNDGEYDTAYLLMPAARLLRESAGTADRLAEFMRRSEVAEAALIETEARLSALTAAIGDPEELLYEARSGAPYMSAALRRIAAAVSPTPTPDEEPTDG